MAVRSKDDAQAFRDAARCLFFSNATVDEFLATATAAQMRAVLEFIGIESGNGAAAKHAKLVRKAKFDEVKSFTGYDFSNVMFPEGYGADDMRSLSFVEAEQDFVFYGQTGRGKTHCAEALGMEAVNAGYEVRFFTVANLVLHLQKLKADGKPHGFMKGLQSARLVILDEFGYVPIDIEGSRLLYQVVAECMKGRSLIITTNIEFGKWGTVLGDDKMAAAIVDRLVEQGGSSSSPGRATAWSMPSCSEIGRLRKPRHRHREWSAPVAMAPMPECRKSTCQSVDFPIAKYRRLGKTRRHAGKKPNQ